jgi:hypothetical protein
MGVSITGVVHCHASQSWKNEYTCDWERKGSVAASLRVYCMGEWGPSNRA